MNKQFLLFFAFLAVATLAGCQERYADKHSPLEASKISGIAIEIQSGQAKRIVISDKDEISEFVANLNQASVNGPWKGASWDHIVLQYADSTFTLNTNGKVFGEHGSGEFYDLNKKYKQYWEK